MTQNTTSRLGLPSASAIWGMVWGPDSEHFEDPASHELLVADDLAHVAETRLELCGDGRAHAHTTSSMPSIMDLIWASV